MRDNYILITGAAGYIGSVVGKMIQQHHYKTIVIDDLRDGKKEAVSRSAIFFQEDFGDKILLKEIFTKYNIKTVLHLAASANVPDSVINPQNYYQNNVISTFNLLEMMKEFQINEIIFSSTAAVYGEPEYNPIDENHPLNPINPYGWSKLMDEQIIKDFAKAYNLKYIIFRYFCAAGATELHGEARSYETHLIPVVLDTLLGKREKVFVFGNDFDTPDGTGVRDYIHVEDIAKAHLLAIEKINEYPNYIFNLGSSSFYSVLQIIKIVEECFNVKIPFEIDIRRPGDPAVLTTIFDNAKNLLGWIPQKSINDIIKSAYKWRRNPSY